MSFRKIAAVVVACAALALGYSLPSALANQAPATSYCTAPNILYSSPPREISATPLDTNFAHAEVCGGQYGDWLTDGPIYPITISFSGSSFNFNIPQNDWVVKGQRIANALVSETAATSNTTYCYINWVTSAWTCNLSSSPPNSFSILGYTVVANGSGITSITNATPAAALFNSITDSSLIGNDGCLNVTSGVIGSTGTACGSGSGGGAVVAGNCLSATPTASPTGATLVAYTCATPTTAPSPTASNGPTSGPGQCTFTGINLNCLFPPTPGATATPVPSPTSSNTAGPCDTLTNTGFSFLLTGNGSCSGTGGVVFTSPYPAATPSVYAPAHSTLGLGQIIIGDAPFNSFESPPPTPLAYPSAILIQNGYGQCESQNYTQLGTTLTTVAGVPGQLLSGGCAGNPGTTFFTIGNHGNFGAGSNYYSTFGYYAGSTALYDTNSVAGFWTESSSTTGGPCGFSQGEGANTLDGMLYGSGGTSFTGICGLGLGPNAGVNANSMACIGSATPGAFNGVPGYAITSCGGTYQATILKETSLTHDWPMNDQPGGATPGPCPSTIADVVSSGGGATAAPSPEVLTVVASPMPHPAGSPLAIQCGVSGPMKNGSTSIQWIGPNTQGAPAYLSAPSPVFETLCKSGGGSCNLPFTVECIVAPADAASIGTLLTAGYAYVWNIDQSPNDASMEIVQSGSGDLANWQSNPGNQQFGLPASGVPIMLDYEFDGTSITYYYINGTLAGYATETPTINNNQPGFFGWDGNTAGRYWNGRMQGCSTYNIALSIQQIQAHYAATGLP